MSPALRLQHDAAPPCERLGRLRVLHVEGTELYAARGLELLVSRDAGLTFERRATLPAGFAGRLLARGRWSARLLRAGFHRLRPMPDGALLAVVRGAVVRCAPGADRFELAHAVERGSRPLELCVSPGGRAYFGEYFSNSERAEVRLYGSDDGRSFDVAHVFPAGAVRHVHGVVADEHRGGVWVLTGDDDAEAGLWWSDDELRTLTPVLRGDQRARAVALLPLADGLLVPMDSPRERNRIHRLDPATGALEELAELPGSAFFAARTERLLLVSTVVEPSAVNRDPRAALLASADGTRWRALARCPRDLGALPRVRELLQYPALLLPSGRSALPFVHATGRALRGLDGRLLRWSERDVLARLDAPAAPGPARPELPHDPPPGPATRRTPTAAEEVRAS